MASNPLGMLDSTIGGIDLVPSAGAGPYPTTDRGPIADPILSNSGKGDPVPGRDSQTGH